MSNYTKSLIGVYLFILVCGFGGMWAMKEAGLVGQVETVERDRPPVDNPHRGGFNP